MDLPLPEVAALAGVTPSRGPPPPHLRAEGEGGDLGNHHRAHRTTTTQRVSVLEMRL